MALGVALCILSPAFLTGIQVLGIPGKGGQPAIMTENAAVSLGVVILLLLCAAGVILLVSNGMKISKYEFLETEEIRLEYGVKSTFEKKKEEFEPTFRKCTTIGIALCILGVIPLIAAGGLGAGDRACLLCTSLLLAVVSAAVSLFVWSGLIHGSFEKVLQTGEYTPENKRLNKKTAWFSGAYWCTTTAVYLLISFVFSNWKISWIIWPVAGVLFAGLQAMIRSRINRE